MSSYGFYIKSASWPTTCRFVSFACRVSVLSLIHNVTHSELLATIFGDTISWTTTMPAVQRKLNDQDAAVLQWCRAFLHHDYHDLSVIPHYSASTYLYHRVSKVCQEARRRRILPRHGHVFVHFLLLDWLTNFFFICFGILSFLFSRFSSLIAFLCASFSSLSMFFLPRPGPFSKID